MKIEDFKRELEEERQNAFVELFDRENG